MLDFIHPKAVAFMQIAMSIGITVFWFNWFRKPPIEPWMPEGHIEYNRKFVYPEALMSFLMVISAVLLFLEIPFGRQLTLVCGGMMLFLTTVDIAYFVQYGLFARDRNGMANAGITLSLSIMSVVMVLRFI